MRIHLAQRADVCKAEAEDALGPSLDEVPGAGASGKSLTYGRYRGMLWKTCASPWEQHKGH